LTIHAPARRVTAADVARSLGVSRATVGFVLNDTPGQTISEATKQRVLAEAARLGYRPHKAAQALAGGRSRIIMMVLPDWPMDHRLQRYLAETAAALEKAGYLLVTHTHRPGADARPMWESLSPEVVMGFAPFTDAELESMHANGITKIIPDPEAPLSTAGKDPASVAGVRMQLEHLASIGHSRLGYAAPEDPRLAQFAQVRVDAARAATARLGLGEPSVRTVDYRDGTADDAVREWLTDGVTAVVAYNDDVAAMVISGALRAGRNVPADLAVIGYDDSPIAAIFVPSISTIHIDDTGLWRQLADLALHEADGRPFPDVDYGFTAELIHREST